LHDKTDGIATFDDHTIRFDFKAPFLDFPRLLGTANVCDAGWVVPEKYYREVGEDGFVQKPIGAGPYELVAQEPGPSSSSRLSKTITGRCTSRNSR
jgi:peptide/nickel transport system substrate-binding protein